MSINTVIVTLSKLQQGSLACIQIQVQIARTLLIAVKWKKWVFFKRWSVPCSVTGELNKREEKSAILLALGKEHNRATTNIHGEMLLACDAASFILFSCSSCEELLLGSSGTKMGFIK